jgi:hypothetical protein
MIYKSSLNHKGNRETFKDLFGCLIKSSKCARVFHFHHLTPPPTYFGGSHSVGCTNSKGYNSSFGHEIQRSTLRKLVDLSFGHEIQRSTLQKFVDF